MREEYEGKSVRNQAEIEVKLKEAEKENRLLIEQMRFMENEMIAAGRNGGGYEESNPVTIRK